MTSVSTITYFNVSNVESLLPENCRVSELLEKGPLVEFGETTIEHRQTRQKCQMIIKKVLAKKAASIHIFKAYSRERELGYLILQRNEGPNPAIDIWDVDTTKGNSEFKGIGSVFMQLAKKVSIDSGCNGRLTLTAVRSSHGFYYKLGFRATGLDADMLNKSIEEELTSAKENNRMPDTFHLGPVEMQL